MGWRITPIVAVVPDTFTILYVKPDAGATFVDSRFWNRGGWIYVSNSEYYEYSLWKRFLTIRARTSSMAPLADAQRCPRFIQNPLVMKIKLFTLLVLAALLTPGFDEEDTPLAEEMSKISKALKVVCSL